jgi:hypothetical protein
VPAQAVHVAVASSSDASNYDSRSVKANRGSAAIQKLRAQLIACQQAKKPESARGREQIAPTFCSRCWRGIDDRMVQYSGAKLHTDLLFELKKMQPLYQYYFVIN